MKASWRPASSVIEVGFLPLKPYVSLPTPGTVSAICELASVASPEASVAVKVKTLPSSVTSVKVPSSFFVILDVSPGGALYTFELPTWS